MEKLLPLRPFMAVSGSFYAPQLDAPDKTDADNGHRQGRMTGSGDDRPIAGITVRLAGDTLAGTSNGNGCS